MRNKGAEVATYISVASIAASALLIMASWIIAAVDADTPIRSLLSGEGIRWLLGSFVKNISSPILVWLLLGGMAKGMWVDSGLSRELRWGSNTHSDYNRMAFNIVVILTILMLTVLMLMPFLPHAILLSAVGTVWGSSLAAFFVPYVALIVAIDSIVYASMTGKFRSVDVVFKSACSGIASIAHYIIMYMCVIEFIYMILWVLGAEA